MISPRMRPRFEMRVPFSSSEALYRLQQKLSHPDGLCIGELAGNQLHLNISPKHQRIWSPHLNLEIKQEDDQAIIYGHFGPRPDIWTLTMALYAIFGFIALMGLMFAASQWMLGMSVWALWVVAGALLMGAIVYILALIGQGLGQDQMTRLLSYVEEAEGVYQDTGITE